LKPRSSPSAPGELYSPRSGRRIKSCSSRGDPFAGCLPREQILHNRGIDPAAVDARIERKLNKPFTLDQEAQLETVRGEFNKAEAAWREANEKELPEEELRGKMEAKREELHALMEKFRQLGHDDDDDDGGNLLKKKEARWDTDKKNEEGDTFSHFHQRPRRGSESRAF
jgi:hypothetical protein